MFVLGFGCVIAGVIFGLFGLILYLGGTHEHIAETRAGPYYVPEQPPGSPHFMVLAASGGIIILIGLLFMAVSKMIEICFRKIELNRSS